MKSLGEKAVQVKELVLPYARKIFYISHSFYSMLDGGLYVTQRCCLWSLAILGKSTR